MRRLFPLLCGLSLVFCLATCVRWAQSSSGAEHWLFVRDLPDNPRVTGNLTAQHNWDLALTRGGVASWESKDWNRWHYRQLTLSYSLVAAFFAIPPSIWIIRHVKQTRRRHLFEAQGRCLSCGYDLRATPDQCPECGRIACQEI